MRPIRILSIVAASLSWSDHASAQPAEQTQETARELFNKAKEEMAAGDHARACPRLEHVLTLLPEHLNTGIQLALCYEEVGRLASAWKRLEKTRSIAAAQGKTDKVQDIEQRMAEIGPRLSRLRLDVPANTAQIPELVVKRDDELVPREQWGVALPIDPGRHSIVAEAWSRETWSQQVEVKAEGETVPVSIGPLSPAPLPPPPDNMGPVVVKPATKQGHEPSPSPRPPPHVPLRTLSAPGLRTAGMIGMGVGGLGLFTTLLLGAAAIDLDAETAASCDTAGACLPPGYARRMDAIGHARAATITFVFGGLLVAAGGLALFYSSPARGERKKPPRIEVTAGWGSVGVRGVW